MHLNVATLQVIIAQDNRNGFEIRKYLQKSLGRFELSFGKCFGKERRTVNR